MQLCFSKWQVLLVSSGRSAHVVVVVIGPGRCRGLFGDSGGRRRRRGAAAAAGVAVAVGVGVGGGGGVVVVVGGSINKRYHQYRQS